MKKIKKIFSIKSISFFLLIYAISMGVATFIEEIYSTDTAKNLIYNSFWFELIMLIICIGIIYNIFKYKLWKKKKIPLLIFHSAFFLIFIGGAISRYFGLSGIMEIREGEINKNFISKDTFIKLMISDNKNNNYYYIDPYLLSNFHYKYNRNFLFKKKIFNVKIVDYIPNAKKKFVEDKKNGDFFLKISLFNKVKKNNEVKNKFKEKYIKKNFNFFYNNKIKIKKKFGNIYLKFLEGGSFFSIKKRKNYKLLKNRFYKINKKVIYKIKNLLFTIYYKKGKIIYVSNKNEKNYLDAIVAKISTNNKCKKIIFFGKNGLINIKKKIKLGNYKIYIGYGSMILETPFFIKLKKFNVENYYGSNNPYFFSSKINIFDKYNKKDYKISMNNPVSYKGYKFFQFGYDYDKKGTKLLVSYDSIGTYISYLGYFFMFVGFILNLFWKGTRFNYLFKKIFILIIFFINLLTLNFNKNLFIYNKLNNKKKKNLYIKNK